MKADVVNAFLDPLISAVRDQLSVELAFEEANAGSGAFVTGDLAAVLGVSGAVSGNVFYDFPAATATEIAHAMGSENKRDVDQDVYQVVQTLANAVWAAIPGRLRATGHESQVASPVLLAKGASVALSGPSLVAHFTSAFGPMSVHICVTESTGR